MIGRWVAFMGCVLSMVLLAVMMVFSAKVVVASIAGPHATLPIAMVAALIIGLVIGLLRPPVTISGMILDACVAAALTLIILPLLPLVMHATVVPTVRLIAEVVLGALAGIALATLLLSIRGSGGQLPPLHAIMIVGILLLIVVAVLLFGKLLALAIVMLLVAVAGKKLGLPDIVVAAIILALALLFALAHPLAVYPVP